MCGKKLIEKCDFCGGEITGKRMAVDFHYRGELEKIASSSP